MQLSLLRMQPVAVIVRDGHAGSDGRDTGLPQLSAIERPESPTALFYLPLGAMDTRAASTPLHSRALSLQTRGLHLYYGPWSRTWYGQRSHSADALSC